MTGSDKLNAQELLAYLCEDVTHEAATVMAPWITQSRRFYVFAALHRSKIRKKLRTATTCESLSSVLLELEVARHFVEDRRCLVEYERYGQGRGRSPDLTVTFRGRTMIHLEVTRVRAPGTERLTWEGKLSGLVCGKLGQMQPENPNVLVVAAQGGSLSFEETALAMKRLKEQMERRDNAFLSRFGFADPADFFKQFQRLSGILLWKQEEHERGTGKSLWVNPQARHPLPPSLIPRRTA